MKIWGIDIYLGIITCFNFIYISYIKFTHVNILTIPAGIQCTCYHKTFFFKHQSVLLLASPKHHKGSFLSGLCLPSVRLFQYLSTVLLFKKFFHLQRIAHRFSLGRKVLYIIFRSLKWAPFRDCLVAMPFTSSILICELKPSAPLTGPRYTPSPNNQRHCHHLCHHTIPLSETVCNARPGFGIQRPEKT